MERKQEQQPPRWRKIGGGSLRWGGKIIKPNQVFRAWPEEIPDSFKDTLIPVDGQATDKKETENRKIAETETVDRTYYKKHIGGGKYHVYNDADKQITEELVTKDKADEMLEALNPPEK